MVAMDVRRPEGLVWVLVLVGSAPASSRRLSGRGASVTWDDPHARTRSWLVPIPDPIPDPSSDGATDIPAHPRPDDQRWARMVPGDLPSGGHVSPQAVRRLACDATVTRIVMAGPSQVLDVGRATRNWSEPQRRAVNARDRQCRGPNCSRPIAWTDIHHVRRWGRDRGPTNLDNGLALCRHCNQLVHDVGWAVALDPTTARATWTSPAGRVTTTDPPQSPSSPPSDPLRPPQASPSTTNPQLPLPERR